MSKQESLLITKFEETVSIYHDKPAICTTERTLTYGQLSQYVDHLARQIGALLVGEKDLTIGKQPAALLFDHGIDSIAAALAALKAGKIYVPFDSTYPLKRLEYMLKHSDARMIITHGPNLETARQLAAATDKKIAILNIDTDSDAHDMPKATEQNPYAYLLYTSGSTGKPKAVLQTQENVYYFIRRYGEILDITPDDRITLFSSFSHDAAVMDIYGALLHGATLYPVNVGKLESLSSLIQWLNQEQITIWHSVPTFFRYFINELETGMNVSFPQLRYIVLGGEAVRRSDIRKFRQLFTETVLYNLYGQTESSYNGGAFTRADHSRNNVDKVLLGDPVKGTELLLLDDEGGMVEELETGELFVASPHIACGYWNDPEATASVFLYAEGTGRLYRTGDMARIDYDGGMEFMGRKDHQVKIRGFRVEPGEIESRLSFLPEIKATAVKTWEDENGDIYLCAYYVLDSQYMERGFNASHLRTLLAGELPDYMIPSYFIELDAMPLTPNGKLDHRALPDPRKGDSKIERIAPRDEMEMKLVGIWAKALGLAEELISIDANFMELGGHSLRAVVLCAEIHKQLQIRMPLAQVFNTPTIRGLAEYIRTATREVFHSIEPTEKKDFYPLSSAQKRLFILQQMDPQSTHYNMPIAARLEGEVESEKFQEAFRRLIERHESLRTSFLIVAGVPVQRVHEAAELEFEILAGRGQGAEGREKENLAKVLKGFIRPFDLSKAPLLRVGLFDLGEKHYILLVDIHHIAADGSSQVILARDFMELLMGKDLPGLKLQYRDYAEWQKGKQEKESLKNQEVFWGEQVAGEIPALHLPTDFPRPGVQDFEGDAVMFELGQEMTGTLKSLAMQQDVTLYMMLLAFLNVLLSKLSGQ